MRSPLFGFALAAASISALALACTSFGSASSPGTEEPEGGSEGGADGGVGEASLDADTPPLPDGAARPPPVTLLTAQQDLFGIAANDSDVFFSEQAKGFVHRVPLSGGAAARLQPTSPGAPRTVGLRGTQVFWADVKQGVFEVDVGNGSSTSAAAAMGLTATGVAVGQDLVFDLARDPTGASSIIEARDPSSLSILGTVVAVGSSTFDLAAGRAEVYWTDSGPGTVMHASGPPVSAPELFAGSEPDCRYIAADAAGAYWIRGDGHIRGKLAAAGGSAFDLATGQDSPVAIAADDLGVYWIAREPGGGVIRRWDRKSGAVTDVVRGFMPIVDSPVQPKRTLALNTLSVVWLTADGSVMRALK